MPNTVDCHLLLLAHTPSPNLQRLAEAIVAGARDSEVSNTAIHCKPPLQANAGDVLGADGVILLTPENLGYMSGALKDFFDRCYYQLLERTDALPYATVVRAGRDGTGTRRAIESICGGLNWRAVQAPLVCRGDWQEGFVDDCRELGTLMALGLQEGMF